MMKEIFDFPALKEYIHEKKLKLRFDALHGGVYGRLDKILLSLIFVSIAPLFSCQMPGLHISIFLESVTLLFYEYLL